MRRLPRPPVTKEAFGEVGGEGRLGGEERLVVYRKSEQTGWLILITVPERQLMQDALKTRKITSVS